MGSSTNTGGFGNALRTEREARGITLEAISAATKISVRMLEAIENEHFERLPGGVFNVNFVRQYARYVGLDEEEAVAAYRRLTASAEEQPDAPSQHAGLGADYDWDRPGESRVWMPATIAVVLLGVGGVLYLWFSTRPGAAPAPAVVAAPETSSAAAPPAPPAEPPPLPAPQTTTPVSAAPAPAAAPVLVELRASSPVWIGITVDGQPRFQGILRTDQTRQVAAQAKVRLRVGDAGVLSVTLNGRPQPPLGPKGQVRTVELTSEGLRTLPVPEKGDR